MTQRRDLKRRVRERQARTGESYVTALRHILRDAPAPDIDDGRAPPPVPVIEMVDVSEFGAALGLRCPIRMWPELAARIDVAAALSQLRDALRATARDPGFAAMRAVVLNGERPATRPQTEHETRQFFTRLRAGIGGISSGGHLLGLTLSGGRAQELVVFALWIMPVPYIQRPPSLLVTTEALLAGGLVLPTGVPATLSP